MEQLSTLTYEGVFDLIQKRKQIGENVYELGDRKVIKIINDLKGKEDDFNSMRNGFRRGVSAVDREGIFMRALVS